MATHGTLRAVEVDVAAADLAPFANIKCTTCGALIPITEALQHQLREQAEVEIRQAIAQREQELAAKESLIVERERSVASAEADIDARVQERLTLERTQIEETLRASARAEVDGEIGDLRARVAAADDRLKQASQMELELRQQKRELEEEKTTLQLEVARRIDSERTKLREEIDRLIRENDDRVAAKEAALETREAAILSAESSFEARVREGLSAQREALEASARTAAAAQLQVELQDLRERADEAERRLKDAQLAELQVRSEKRTLEAEKQALEVDVARRVDVELARVREEATQAADDRHRLKEAEKERKLQEVLRLNEELRRKIEQGSQQGQGEVLEETLEDALKAQFPFDVCEPVAKGISGADVVQRVYTRSGQYCGAIVWESKNTKNWSDNWIEKLRDDQHNVKADVAVIVSTALPREIRGCGYRDGVWVAEPRVALGLATALRTALIEIAVTKRTVASKNESVEILFAYLTGTEFRQRIDAIVRTFVDMQTDLEEEKRASTRRWAKREKHIARVLQNTSGMYGDLQGLLGAAMPSVPLLEQGEDSDALR